MKYNLDKEILKAWEEFNSNPNEKRPMSNADRKEYKRLLSWRNFLRKKQRKLERKVELYNKLDHIINIELYNAINEIENKYK